MLLFLRFPSIFQHPPSLGFDRGAAKSSAWLQAGAISSDGTNDANEQNSTQTHTCEQPIADLQGPDKGVTGLGY